MKKCTLIDNDTGEILNEHFNIDEMEDVKRKRKMVIKGKNYGEFKQVESEYLGEFVFYVFEHIDQLEKILNDNYLIKFLYCCSFVKNNGYLMLDDTKTYINKKQLKMLLNISSVTFNKFFNVLLHNELIKVENNKLHMNANICWQGNKKKHENIINKKVRDFTRLYIKTIRTLYKNTPTRSHKKLSIVYKLLPYTNWKYNILCKFNTINETDQNKIEPLIIKDIMNILGYDIAHLARFKKDFYSFKYNNYNIFLSIQSEADYQKSFVFVNPLFFYRGDNIEVIKYLITIFKITKS